MIEVTVVIWTVLACIIAFQRIDLALLTAEEAEARYEYGRLKDLFIKKHGRDLFEEIARNW